MKSIKVAILGLVLLASALADFSVVPTSHNWESNNTASLTKQFNVYSFNDNGTQTVLNLTASGDHPEWFAYPPELTIPPSGSNIFTLQITPGTAAGNYTTKLVLVNQNGLEKDVNIAGKVYPVAPFSASKWIYQNDVIGIQFSGISYTIIVNSAGTSLEFDVYDGNNKIAFERLGENDQTNDLDPLVIKTSTISATGGRAKVTFQTDDPATKISLGKLGGINVYPGTKTLQLASLEDRTILIKFTNNYDTAVDISGVALDPETDGFILQEVDTPSSLAVGDSVIAKLLISPRQLTFGDHSEIVELSGQYRGRNFRADSIINLRIPTGISGPLNYSAISLDMPNFAGINEPFHVTVNNVFTSSDVSIAQPIPALEIIPQSIQVVHGVWSADFKMTRPGEYVISFALQGAYFASRTIYIGSKDTWVIEFDPVLKNGVSSTIKLRDNATGKVLNATFKIDGTFATTITPDANKQYNICAGAYNLEQCQTVEYHSTELSVNFLPFKPGDIISFDNFTIRDATTSDLVSNITVLVDGKNIQTDPFTLDEKSYNLSVTAPGYDNYTATLTVAKPKSQGGDLVGLMIWIIFAVAMFVVAGYAVYRLAGRRTPKNIGYGSGEGDMDIPVDKIDETFPD